LAIFTIGYEGITIDEFIAALRASRISHLMDIREMPLSRKKGFSKTALASAVEAAGIRYSHVRELGCPKLIRDRYRHDADWSRYVRGFSTYLQTQSAPLAALRAEMKRGRVCLMCFEADFDQCHRSIVARSVVGTAGSRITHIGADGLVTEGSAAVA
jgi:uncharacterized protein (DUF488 family)